MAPKKMDERTPLLQFPGMGPASAPTSAQATNQHLQFCAMVGMPPLPHPSLPDEMLKNFPKPHRDLLYQRALRRRRSQGRVYMFTASLANSLLLSQVVLGATLTALGASNSSHILITLFGAMNTIIAGLVAYLKSRGQPMRARMYREDLERLVGEIENSATMWLGISANVHGYDAIDTEDRVTIRGEVARLTRMWDAAVSRNVSNDPDMYAAGVSHDAGNDGLRAKAAPGAGAPPLPPVTAPPTALPAPSLVPPPAAAALTGVVADPDAAPATAPSEAKPTPSPSKPADPPNETKPAPSPVTPAAPAPPAEPATTAPSKGDPPKTAPSKGDPPESAPSKGDPPEAAPSPSPQTAAAGATPAPSPPAPIHTGAAPAQQDDGLKVPGSPIDPDASPASAVISKIGGKGKAKTST